MNRNIHYIYNIALLLLIGVATPLHAQKINGKIYGGGELAAIDGDTRVEVYTGTVGDNTAFDGGVFGGGLGEPTIVTGNVDVLIGRKGAEKDAAGPTINGDVYGGSALGNTNCSAELVATDGKSTSVDLNAGTINGSMYGGALGQKSGVNGASKDVAANVYGPVQVDVNGGIVLRRDGDDGGVISGGIYGCNNLNGSPQSTVDVDVWHHNTAKSVEDKYTLFAVYGGGNQANYVGGTPDVTVHGCDNSIKYVYGGGNAAHLTHESDDGNGNMVGDGNTNVIIWGCELIGSVFGGGNGQVQAANVSGDTNVKIYGGTIENVFGGSNTNGMIGGATNVHVLAQGEVDPSDVCLMALTNVYGGGNMAAGKSGTVDIVCTGDGTIDNVYGGAYGADLTGDIELNIHGGQITNVFGGNNNSGRINGAITVNVDWATGDGACGTNSLTNVYGGGNKALYSVYGYNDDGTAKDKADDQDPIAGPTVNLKNGTVSNNVYGGGLGKTAVVTGNPVVNLMGVNAKVGTDETIADKTGGSIFGGGSLANTFGNPSVIVTIGSAANVYGGGALADVTGDTYVSLMGGSVGSAYGGGLGKSGDDAIAAAVSGTANISLGKENADGSFDGICVVGNIFGCNDTYGAPAHAVVTTYSGTVNNVYGGGNQAAGNSAPVVYLVGGAIKNNVYGGGLGESAVITGNPIVNLWGATVGTWEDGVLKSGGNIFGGGEAAPVKGNPMVSTASGTAGNVYAGGFGATAVVTGNPTANIDQHAILYADVDEYNAAKGTNLTADAFEALDNTAKTRYAEKTLTVQNVFGGGSLAGTNGATSVTVSGGTVSEDVYGGGALANVSGNTSVVISGGTSGDVYGGGLGSAEIAASVVNTSVRVTGGSANNVFGCNNTNGAPTGTVNVEIAGGTINNNVYGGGNLAAATVSPVVTVSGGTITHDVYGGGALANVSGNTSVVISGGTSGDVYGGGLGSAEIAASVVNTSVRVTGGSANNVFGCNNTNGAPTGTVNVEIAGGTVNNNVYGGGNLASATVNPIVTVTGGTVTHDVYGGGALADVTGNTTVNLTRGAVGGAYGGALGQKNGVNGATSDIAAYVNGNTTVTLNGTQITETGVFGANNLNGTPTGHVKVHVTKTAHRDGQATPYNQDGTNTNSYDVPAVYGGGNKAAYEPTSGEEYAEVLIENCDNSIEYVYGGGNAAPVPATQVTIYGANAINYAFAGGNGAGQSANPSAADYNPGADVGYKGYYSQTGEETPIYGTGETHIKIYGGTINHVFGGSNTLGYIRTHAYVEVLNIPDDDTEHKENICELHLGEVQAGGNEAEMYCGGSVSLACSEGAEVVYAGSNDADIHGDINLVITSGTYGKVFGGNNHSGNVYGGIKINIDETGCWPVMIGELYACGNEAPYSVFGYQYDSETEKYLPRTKKQYDAMTPEEKTTANMTTPYTDPKINLISFTRIGKVFGGGYGNTAVLYGNTHVNVEPIPGIFADGKSTPAFVLNQNDKRVANTSSQTTLQVLGADKIGSIGAIYGGGNAGAVYGNTNVNIGLLTKNKHISGTDTTTEKEVAVTITGDVFGGGNEAIVYGNTNVKIGE